MREEFTLVEGLVEWVAFCCVLLATIALVLPKLLREDPKKMSIPVAHGTPAALRQIYVATLKYQNSGRNPRSLDDLKGISVPPASGRFVEFSKEGLNAELGTNAENLLYVPQLLRLLTNSVAERIVLAYAPAGDPGYCEVMFADGKIRTMPSAILKDLMNSLETQLQRQNSQAPP